MAKHTGRAVSDIMGIDDKYIAFCVDEAALFLLGKITQSDEQNGNKLLQKIAKRKK